MKVQIDTKVDGPFWVIERVNDNAYKVDLSSDYNVQLLLM
jgi:hypothetical protein